ncbi:MAG: hypothetical protein Q4G24_07555 [Paracoccus sp. (in: a-proteobacteria)]|uniref:hypothetical protein n=1 Tax=Paracoccus sp. TaxID=267 RepID=UPI0026E004AC|nr:hypothetical protein [Paracoccus sp. (in: a-proteobacteria)]MDO5621310.1 hypothetical protein [Paracoccus sp. (in: a-proteobacteria)]
MRKLIVLAVLGLAACNENAGWNPNYTMNATAYGEYQRDREKVLMQGGKESQVIPMTRPFNGPTADEIKGDPVVIGVPVVRSGTVTSPAPVARPATGSTRGYVAPPV